MKQTWKKQLHRKLLASTAVLVGAAIALPVIAATTHSAMAAPAAKEVNGTSVTETGATVTNTDGVGVYVHNNGQLTENGVLTVTTSNSGTAIGHPPEHGIQIDGTGSSVILNDNAIITLDPSTLYSNGIHITNGGKLNANGVNNTVTVNLNGANTAGVYMSGANSTINSAGTIDINIIENGNYGFQQVGGTSTLHNLTIDIQKDGATGYYVKGGGTSSVDTINIQTNGGTNSSQGVYTKEANSKITIGGGEVHINSTTPDTYVGSGASAFTAKDHGEIDVTGDITLDTSVVSGGVVSATGGAIIKFDNQGHTTSITSNSDISDGLRIGRLAHAYETNSGDPNSTIISNGNLNITTNKATSFGIGLSGIGATLQTGANSSTTIHSAGTAIKFEAGQNQTATLNNATITSDGQVGSYQYGAANQINDPTEQHNNVNNDGNLFQVGGKDNIQSLTSYGPNVYTTYQDNSTNSSLTLNNSVATAGGGKLLMDVRSSGATGSTFTFNNDNTELHGGIATQAGSTLTMGLANASAWYIDQNSNLTDLTNDDSSIIFDQNHTFKTLTTDDYNAANNSSILFNTQLGDDSSPTDKLIVNNTVTGTTGVYVVNDGGFGAQTTGNGIQLIDAGSTNANSFSLQNAVNAGLFSYDLFRGGTTPNATTDNDYFLRSEYRNEAPAAAALPAMSWQVVLSMLPNLHERMPFVDGSIPQEPADKDDRSQASLSPKVKVQNASLSNDYGAPTLQNALYNPNNQRVQIQKVALFDRGSTTMQSQQSPIGKGVWARLMGQNLKFQSHDDAGSGFDGNIWGLQAGLDFYSKIKDNGSRQFAGAYLANASSSGDVLSNAGKVGSLDLDATSLGLYYTKYSADGWYLDGIAQYSWLRNVKARTGTETIEPDGSSYTFSIEAGKQLYRDRSVILEPQAQLIYSHNSLDDVTLSDDTVINIANLNAMTGRFGARVFPNPNRGNKLMPWASANVWHTFSNNSTISSSGVNLQTPIGGTVGELAAGIATRPGNDGGWSFNASLGYLFNISGADYSGLKGSLGIRKNW